MYNLEASKQASKATKINTGLLSFSGCSQSIR